MISIIIPVYNEYDYLHLHAERLLERCYAEKEVIELIFVDGGSNDNTVEFLASLQDRYSFSIIHSEKGRAKQLNAGAKKVSGEIVFFLFCDCFPESGFARNIMETTKEYSAGCLTFRYDSNKWYLKLFSYFASKKFFLRHKFGDSGIFCKHDVFMSLGGFDESNILEHDNAFINMMLDRKQFQQISSFIMVSPRIFEKYSFVRVMMTYAIIHFLYKIGISQVSLKSIYKFLLS